MNTKMVAEYCLSKPGAVLEHPYGPQHPAVFKCGGKIFIVFLEKDDEAWLHLKFEPLFADFIKERYPSITGAYNYANWSKVPLDSSVPADEVTLLIDHSYQLIFRSLTKKVQGVIEQDNRRESEG